MHRRKVLAYGVAAAISIALVILFWLYPFRAALPNRVFRIGFAKEAPYASTGPDGAPQGLAVEIISEAARRRHVRLQWVQLQTDAPTSLLKGVVDLWPMLGVTPERQRAIHMTKPWLTMSYCLVSRKANQFANPAAVAGRTVAITGFQLARRMAVTSLPGAHLVITKPRYAVLESVCEGRMDAAFEEASFVAAAVLDRRPACVGVPLAVSLVAGVSGAEAICSTKGASAVADALRDEIMNLAGDGTMARSLDLWSSFSAGETRAILNLQASEAWSRMILYILVATAMVTLILL